jgi:ribonucleoside-diphosphate reductase alpha chain
LKTKTIPIFDERSMSEILDMFRSFYRQATKDIVDVLEWEIYDGRTLRIPNLTFEYIQSLDQDHALREYYEHVVFPLLEERYLHRNEEDERDIFRRVASRIASNSVEEELFYIIMRLRLFMPATPTLMNAGREKGTLSSCFVIIPEDDMTSIASYWKNMSLVQKYGGGVGTDWSSIRPRGTEVGGTNGIASGFAPFLEVANSINSAIRQGSARSGANSSTMRYNHPDIMEFIDFKRDDPSKFGFFNLSVTFDDEGFIKCWNNKDVELIHNGRVYGIIKGREILERMAENAWLTGDPSPYFLDRTNEVWRELVKGEADPFGFAYEDRISHNPCGEQNLPNNGVCNLGSVNLLTMTDPIKNDFSYDLLGIVSRIATVFLDKVIDNNWFPNWRIDRQSKHLRNIGLGFMGLADVLYMKELDYNSEEAVSLAWDIAVTITHAAKEQSLKMGRDIGVAPVLRDTNKLQYRNTDFTCIAPTGSISLLSFVNNGMEPFFGLGYKKLIYPKGTRNEEKYINVQPPVFMLFDRKVPRTSHNYTAQEHLAILKAVGLNVTNAVSKTVNLPNRTTKKEILNLYKQAFDDGIKSVTVFRDGCRDDLALVLTDEFDDNKCCAVPNRIFTDGCQKCTNCSWEACSA